MYELVLKVEAKVAAASSDGNLQIESSFQLLVSSAGQRVRTPAPAEKSTLEDGEESTVSSHKKQLQC